MKVVRLSALSTGRLYLPEDIAGILFCYKLSRPKSHNAAGRIISMKNLSDITGNRNRDLSACSAVPQPTGPSRAVWKMEYYTESKGKRVVHTITRRKANWIGRILSRNCILKRVIEGKLDGNTERAGRRWRRRKQLPDDPKEKVNIMEMEEEAFYQSIDNSLWKSLWICSKTDCMISEWMSSCKNQWIATFSVWRWW